jgi:hypothetical protein
MKAFLKFTMVLATCGVMLTGCSPEGVGPGEDSNAPALSGAIGDPHPFLDTVCQNADTMFLVREDDGSPIINKCFGPIPGRPGSYPAGVMRPCTPAEEFKWGYLEMVEGYFADTGYIDCNFTMAPGWYCDRNNWQFSIASSFQFDNNGIPLVTNDWSSNVVRPLDSRWQLRVKTTVLPDPCYAVALRVTAVKLNLFGAILNGSSTVLWGRNRNWNVPGSAANSPSQWLQTFCPLRCLETPPPPPVDSSCVPLIGGAVGYSNCATIAANTTGLTGNLTYQWSTGATTPSVNVCPTATTTYSVTISSNGTPAKINAITVNYLSAACGNGNGSAKVWVCHVPPGNPSNVQDICISVNALPAHVERFRAPGSNPNQGHDSGCEIGRCGSNPCL